MSSRRESDFLRLEKLIKEIEEQRQQERQRADEQQQRADEQRQRAEASERQTRLSTLDELLEACHSLSKTISVQTNKSLSTKGSTTNPKDKFCPTYLRQWTDFPGLQLDKWEDVHKSFNPSSSPASRRFSPLLGIELVHRNISNRKIASEGDLRLFQHNTVENFVREIIQEYGHEISFENHSNSLGNITPQKPTCADQLCAFQKENDQLELAFIIEYKAPHKLTKKALRSGLHEMNLPEEVVQRSEIPTDPDEKYQYDAEQQVGAAVTQLYSYMLESGIAHGCIETGESKVYLLIKEDMPDTVYFHLAEPNEDVENGGEGFKHPLTAVAQLTSFFLIALQSRRRDQRWRDSAMQNAQTWTADWEKILKGIPDLPGPKQPKGSPYIPQEYPIEERSPYYIRRQKKISYQGACYSSFSSTEGPDEPSGGEGGGPKGIATPSRGTGGRRTRQQTKNTNQTKDSSSTKGQQRQYCTQDCLLGLVKQRTLDRCCPNYLLHRQGTTARMHLLTKQRFLNLVRKQLAITLDENCTDLRKQGARGMLFKISLDSHGYTFVAKGTVDAFIPDLKHEAQIYRRLHTIQGKIVPVCLGNIDLIKPWRDLGVRITHMLLMAWGGEQLDETEAAPKSSNADIGRCKAELERLGVQHDDLRAPNILWNDEIKQVMLIDFEGATTTEATTTTTTLGEPLANRKRKRSEPTSCKRRIKRESEQREKMLAQYSADMDLQVPSRLLLEFKA